MKMTPLSPTPAAIICAAVACFAVLSPNLQALANNPWTLADDFQYVQGLSALAYGVGSDPAGNVYVVGYGASGTNQHALTRKSSDGGATWTLVDDFAYPGSSQTQFYKVSSDSVARESLRMGWRTQGG